MQPEYNAIGVMLGDESHRIRVTSNSRYTPKKKKSDQPQITELLHASKTAVFFVDDNQIVRPGEIGLSDYIQASRRFPAPVDPSPEYICRPY
ncbi:MAG TPA: DNA/RNA helicase domain-containing protein [Terriglobales bacterium]